MNGLTRMRFVLALWVVLFHYLQDHAMPFPMHDIVWAGYQAVPFFFLLSGFVLSMAYSRNRLDGPAARKEYAWRRFARLYPGFLASILAFGLLKLVIQFLGIPNDFDVRESWRYLPLVVLGLQSWLPEAACVWNCPTWSLSTEFAFYVAFPLLVLLPRIGRVLAFVAACAYQWMFVMHPDPSPLWDGHAPPVNAAAFLAGMLLWESRLAESQRVRRVAAVLVLPVAVTLVYAISIHNDAAAPFSLPGTALLAFPWLAAVPPVLALAARQTVDRLPWWTYLGEASYALYLWHVPLHMVWRGGFQVLGLPEATLMLELFVYAPASVVASLVFYRWLERTVETWILRRALHRPVRPPSVPSGEPVPP